MSITALVGLPGHGKSYSAWERYILPALKAEMKVVTNIPMTPEVQFEFPDQVIEFDLDLAAESDEYWDRIPPSSMCVFDELWRIWPAGLKPNRIPKRQLSFIKEHRHYVDETGKEPEIILVTQDLSDVAMAIRQMVEITCACIQLVDVGLSNRFRRDYYRGAIKGTTAPKTMFISSEDGLTYREDVFKYYQSHTKATGTISSVNRTKVNERTIFSGWRFRSALGVLMFLIVSMFGLYSSARDGMGDMVTSVKGKDVSRVKSKGVSGPGLVPQVVERYYEMTKVWRVVGTVMLPGRSYVLITDGGVTRRRPLNECKFRSELECVIQGEMVTTYTGRHPTIAGSAFSAHIPVAGGGTRQKSVLTGN